MFKPCSRERINVYQRVVFAFFYHIPCFHKNKQISNNYFYSSIILYKLFIFYTLNYKPHERFTHFVVLLIRNINFMVVGEWKSSVLHFRWRSSGDYELTAKVSYQIPGMTASWQTTSGSHSRSITEISGLLFNNHVDFIWKSLPSEPYTTFHIIVTSKQILYRSIRIPCVTTSSMFCCNIEWMHYVLHLIYRNVLQFPMSFIEVDVELAYRECMRNVIL